MKLNVKDLKNVAIIIMLALGCHSSDHVALSNIESIFESGDATDLFNEFLSLSMSGSFSLWQLLSNSHIIASLILGTVAILFSSYLFKSFENHALILNAARFLSVGMTSNVMHRITCGHVPSYISTSFLPVLNFGDILIIIGLIVFLIIGFVQFREPCMTQVKSIISQISKTFKKK